MVTRRPYPNLRAALDGMGITQQAFADRVGVTQGAIANYLAGQRVPSLRLALRIAAEANIPVESLLTSPKGDEAVA